MSEAVWQTNLRDAILLDPLVLVHGNVKDLFPISIGVRNLPASLREHPYLTFDSWLAIEFEQLGFPIVLIYDPVDGAVVLRGAMADPYNALAAGRNRGGMSTSSTAGSSPLPGPSLPRSVAASPSGDWMVRLDVKQRPIDFFRTLYENIFPQSDTPIAVICRFTDRFLSFTDRQDADEKQLSMLIQKAVLTIPQQMSAARLRSRLALVFNTEGEAPQELHIQAPFAHSVLIPPPNVEEREEFFRAMAGHFDQSTPGERFLPEQDPVHLRLVAHLTEGLKTQDLFSLIALSERERLGLGPGQVKTLVDRFKFGTRENAWLKIKPETLHSAKQLLEERVKGQKEIIDEVVPVLIRAKLGMTDLASGPHSSKPRGTFFFVGPTGVGKTELSKAIAALLFGDERAMIRFDMSEYSEEHQQARLIGAPPGYVGFDQGGQLTNAIIERPFSVVLFDEIEKAHGRILDKFLQILDDGRLTDGMGRTVYFSEAILIFTSNIGTAPRAAGPRHEHSAGAFAPLASAAENMEEKYSRLAELSYEELSDHFRNEVKNFFINTLGRPEILNRIGEDNILVFRFITDSDAKDKIVDQQIQVLTRMLREKHHVGLFCTKGFRSLLMTHANGFERNGARGVRNLLNRLVLNPLAEQLFLRPDECLGKTFRADYLVGMDSIAEIPFDKSALTYEWITE